MQWSAHLLVMHRVHRYDPENDKAAPEGTFIFLCNPEEQHYHIVVDLAFREGYGRVPHREVLQKLRRFKKFENCEVVGGGILRANVTVGNYVSSYHSEALGKIPALYHDEVRICFGLQKS